MYNISCTSDNPYAGVISTFIKREFPVFVNPKDADMLDLLTDAFVASGQIRFGPKPSPEALVAIREVITHWTAQNLPIPVLTPWGSEKPDGSSVDIAELFGLKTLSCLNSRVKNYYAPGITVNLRIEDASAPHLFFDRMEQARKDAALYTADFVKLVRSMALCNFVRAIPESSLVSEATFNATADKVMPHLEAYLSNPSDPKPMRELEALGWKGQIAPESINYYMERYKTWYADKTTAQHYHILARYYAGSLTRKIVGSTGADKEWGGKYIEIALHTPVPGVDSERVARRVYYRTMPSSLTSNHIPPWRAKGYLKINGEVSASLTGFHSGMEFNYNTIKVSNGVTSQEVRADYVIV